MNKRFKNILCFVLITATIFCFAACGNKTPNNSEPTEGQASIVETKYNATAYLLDYWRTDLEDGSRVYTYPIVIYSDDYCANFNETQIKYYKDLDPVNFIDAFSDTKIQIANFNDIDQHATRILLLVQTSQIVDTKKMTIHIAGGKTHIANTYTKDEYVAAGGNSEDWCLLNAYLSNRNMPLDAVFSFTKSDDHSFIKLIDTNNSMIYYQKTDNIIKKNDSIVREFDLEKINENCEFENITKHFIEDMYAASLDGTEFKQIELDPNIQIYGEVVEDKLFYGYKTVDGSNIDPYISSLPEYLVYNLDQLVWFHVNLSIPG